MRQNYIKKWFFQGIAIASAAVQGINELCSTPELGCEDSQDPATTYLGVGIGAMILAMIVIVILPLIYIYFWIVVNSLRKSITQERLGVLPHAQNQVWVTQQPVMVQKPVNPEYNNPGYIGEEEYY